MAKKAATRTVFTAKKSPKCFYGQSSDANPA